ncbi:MAG TPA: hypothetical protein VD993_12320 [Chitinophagaceae bacterium]|nr:hypothetical protein [Chitinophagaceae bacterium]
MTVLCSPAPETQEVAMYDVQKVNNNFYQATLKKFVGNKNKFPGVLLLWRNPNDWTSLPEGHSSLVDCLTNELEKWLY